MDGEGATPCTCPRLCGLCHLARATLLLKPRPHMSSLYIGKRAEQPNAHIKGVVVVLIRSYLLLCVVPIGGADHEQTERVSTREASKDALLRSPYTQSGRRLAVVSRKEVQGKTASQQDMCKMCHRTSGSR